MMTARSKDNSVQGDIVRSSKLLFVFFTMVFFILVLPLFWLPFLEKALSGFLAFDNLVLFCAILCFAMALLASFLKSDFHKTIK